MARNSPWTAPNFRKQWLCWFRSKSKIFVSLFRCCRILHKLGLFIFVSSSSKVGGVLTKRKYFTKNLLPTYLSIFSLFITRGPNFPPKIPLPKNKFIMVCSLFIPCSKPSSLHPCYLYFFSGRPATPPPEYFNLSWPTLQLVLSGFVSCRQGNVMGFSCNVGIFIVFRARNTPYCANTSRLFFFM